MLQASIWFIGKLPHDRFDVEQCPLAIHPLGIARGLTAAPYPVPLAFLFAPEKLFAAQCRLVRMRDDMMAQVALVGIVAGKAADDPP